MALSLKQQDVALEAEAGCRICRIPADQRPIMRVAADSPGYSSGSKLGEAAYQGIISDINHRDGATIILDSGYTLRIERVAMVSRDGRLVAVEEIPAGAIVYKAVDLIP